MLPREATATANFLRSKLLSQLTSRGEMIQINDQKASEIKFLIEKFLHQEGLEAYRVLSESGVIRVVADARDESIHKVQGSKVKGVPPFPPLSTERLPLMQTVYPNYGSSPIIPLRKKKRG